jgi:hypothetical protein
VETAVKKVIFSAPASLPRGWQGLPDALKHLACVVVALLVGAVPRIASAEGRPTLLADHDPNGKAAAIDLSLGWYTDSQNGVSAHVLAPTLGGRVRLSQNAELTLDWPLAFVMVSPAIGSSQSSFRTGNPVITAFYMRARQDAYFRIGGGVALPLAHIGGNPGPLGTSALAYAGAAGMNGLWNMWQYAVDRFTLVLPAELETRSGPLVLGGDFGLGVLVYTGSGSADPQAVFQLAGMLGARIDNVTLGGKLQVVWLATQGGDNAQLALVPFVQADFSGGGFLYARFVMNLDEPLGVFGHNRGLFGKMWGLFIGAGTRF